MKKDIMNLLSTYDDNEKEMKYYQRLVHKSKNEMDIQFYNNRIKSFKNEQMKIEKKVHK